MTAPRVEHAREDQVGEQDGGDPPNPVALRPRGRKLPVGAPAVGAALGPARDGDQAVRARREARRQGGARGPLDPQAFQRDVAPAGISRVLQGDVDD
jgi:hypothetical protein